MIKCYYKFLFNRNFYWITFLLLAIVAKGQSYPEDIQLSTINYTNYVPPTGQAPEYLVPFTESLSNNTVTRISDSQVFGTTGPNLRHHYSVTQPWNSDGSLIMLQSFPSAILDGETYEFLFWSDVPSEAKWSNSQPNIMYGAPANKFVSYNVSTNQTTTLHSFNSYAKIDFGYNKGNQSVDDKYVGLIGTNNNQITLITYDIQNDIIVGELNLGDMSNQEIKWFSVSPSGEYAILAYGSDGSGEYQGYKRYNINLTNKIHLYDSTAHGDMGFDANGNEVLVQFGDSNVWNQDYYLTMIQIENAQVTPLFYWPQEDHNGLTGIWGGHVSLRNTNRPGWAYVSEGCCTDHPVAAREIFAIKLDGSNTVERFAIHHSDYTAGYGHEAQAVPNRDGSKVMFGSNWNNAFGGQYAPSYIVEKKNNTNTSNVTANAGADVSICEGSSTTLTATGGDQYLWNTGETTASIQVSPTTTSTYTVTVSSGGESDTDSVVVTVNTIPVANAGNDISIEEGQSTTLTASGGTSYLWSTGSTSQSITVSPNVTTTYSVQVFENNCSSTDEITIQVIEPIIADAGIDVTICNGESIELTASGGSIYNWNTGENTKSIVVAPTHTSVYEVTVSNGISQAKDKVKVTVLQCDNTSLDLNNDLANSVEFSVFPNPTNGTLNVKLIQLNNLSNLMLYDMLGKALINKTIDPNVDQQFKLDLSSYPKGIYILTIIQNGEPFSKKIVLY